MQTLSKIVINNKNFPKVLIAGKENDLLCQYIIAGNNNIEANVYFDSDSAVTIEFKENNSSKAIYDFFSLRDIFEISKLIGFIDMTLSPQKGIITYSRGDFPKYVIAAMENGGIYPKLRKDKNLFYDLTSYKRKNPSLLKRICKKFLQKEKLKKTQDEVKNYFVSVICYDR